MTSLWRRDEIQRRKDANPPRDDGVMACRECGAEKPLTDFPADYRYPNGRAPKCRGCVADIRMVGKHGMTNAEKASIAEQQGGCAICHRPDPGGKGWVVDHDHACCSGESSCPSCRRGVLCQWCNNSLGYAFDDPDLLRAMADYIEQHRSSDRSSERSSNRTERTERTNEDVGHLPAESFTSVTRARAGIGTTR